MSETVPNSSEATVQPAGPDLWYVFCEHIPENVPEIAGQLQGADIVALESVGLTEEERAFNSKVHNAVTGNEPDEELFEMFWPQIQSMADSDFENALLVQLQGSGKRIEQTDIGKEHPQYGLLDEEALAGKDLEAAIRGGDIAEVRESFEVLVEKSVQTVVAREALVADQVEALIAAHPSAKIAVIAGAIHTPLSHGRKDGVRTERVFIDSGYSEGRGLRHAFTPSAVALRAKRFRPERTLDKNVLDRALLDTLIIHAGYSDKSAAETVDSIDDAALDREVRGAIGALHDSYKKAA